MKKYILITLVLFLSYSLHSQTFSYKKSNIQAIKLKSTIDLQLIDKSYLFTLQNLEMPVPGGNSYKSYLMNLKQNMPAKNKQYNHHEKRSNVLPPALKNNFEGNEFHGHVPNDNDLAISNDGKIISVTNSIIYFFNKDSMLRSPISLKNFVDTFPQKNGKYDPKVLYDPDHDRFIMCFLNGFSDSTSHIFMAFSKTNDPTGEWNIYTIPGNPLTDSSWSDFPMFAITKDELFFTINLLRHRVGNETWKNTFKQTLIWQMDKKAGYEGKDLNAIYYHDIEYEGIRLRNLCPVKAGNDIKGPNMYFLSNRNFSLGTDSFYIVEVTGKANDKSTELKVYMSKSNNKYGVPPLADQPFNKQFETNDARVLDAYLENDKIVYVGNTVNFNNNLATIYLGEVTKLKSTQDINLKIIDHGYLEFGYPSIAYSGKNGSDESIILMNHTSDSIYPGVSTFFYENGKMSEIISIKNGDARVSVQSGKAQRWGDYTGIQRKYNEDGIVWANGYWGKRRKTEFPANVNATWIFELINPNYNTIGETKNPSLVGNLYPNPTSNIFYFEFNNPITQYLNFRLIDINGKTLAEFGTMLTKKGENALTFNLDKLDAGVYFLRIESNKGIITTKQVIKK